ncbi:MAG: helicase [Chloroflexi bacterium]|nr:helicase [Chloroflexota bacterium]
MSDALTATPVKIRQELLEIVMRDLLGPANGPEEIITEQTVRDRYILGLLAPKGQTPLPEEDEDLAFDGTDGEDGKSEPVNVQGRTMLPSSMGMTFTIAPEASEIVVTARWGHYDRIPSAELGLDLDPPKPVWKRKQIEASSEPIPIKEGRIPRWIPDQEFPDVYIDGRIRRIADQWVITLFLVNGQQEPRQLKDTAWIFQPELTVEAPDGEPIFIRRMNVRGDANPEDLAMQMVYRKQVEFAVGHGVATHVELLEGSFDRAVRIKTDTAPTYELPKTIAPDPDDVPGLKGVVLDMKTLSEIPDGQFSVALSPLLIAYRIWLDSIQARAISPVPDLQPYTNQAKTVVENCQRILSRLENAIALLDTNPQAADAFRFANRAMWQQRVHSLYTLSVRQKKNQTLEEIDTPQNRTWYLFQLAFILINLPGMVDPTHPERSDPTSAIADVLWFPTGGGKTEAYLGLTAFTLAIRRLQGRMGEYDGSAGVTVLMRYTLRLLTLQQFQRATALICACELIRKSDIGKWGNEPFRIGLWIGMRSTPNWTDESDQVVKEYRRGGSFRSSAIGGSGTPHQLTNCPWCGETLIPGRDIQVETFKAGAGRTYVYCPSSKCEFNERNAKGEGLPVVVVDEEVYRRLPSLLIATVDKFAQMPWKGEVQMLFGKVNAYCPRHGFRSPDIDDSESHPAHKQSGLPAVKSEERGPLRPPDLIIQDELHLINGPLGTLVGLYETAIDGLSTWEYQHKIVRPKVIASSATIRRASEQVHALYMRKANIFPPSGLDIEDNFFSRQISPSEETPGRLYFGVCAPGVQAKVVMIRVYSAFLSAAQFLYKKYGGAADPYMTLIGYFNAMRELGGLRRLVDDAISTRLRQMDKRGMENRKFHTNSIKELTSRVGATDIPETLDRLNAVFDPNTEKERQTKSKTKEKIDYSEIPIDVLLATNMISVGVDVPRLGLMVVTGQPKYTAEYIQATSRIGRRFPGLVCTVYNWVRPRDLSHFERFEHYHATLYQQVEPLSVTPFSARAMDRGLSALLVSYVRLLGDKFNGNRDAGSLKAGHDFIIRAMNEISQRAANITFNSELEEIIREELNLRISNWLANATTISRGGGSLGYKTENDGHTIGLLVAPGRGKDMITCLTSLRDVEPPVTLILNNYELRTPVKIVEGEEPQE